MEHQETKTVLALLEKRLMTKDELEQLNRLTAQQAGYEVRQTGYADREQTIKTFALFLNGTRIANTNHSYEADNVWKHAPRFVRSVDSCLKLSKPHGLFWDLQEAAFDTPNVASLVDFEAHEVVATGEDAEYLSLAMLRAYWQRIANAGGESA